MTEIENKALDGFQKAIEVVQAEYYKKRYWNRVVKVYDLLAECVNAAYEDYLPSKRYFLTIAATSAAAMAADLNAGSNHLDSVLGNAADKYEDLVSGEYRCFLLVGSDRERALNLIGCFSGLVSAHYVESEDGTEQSREWAEDEATYVLMLLLNWLALVLDEEGD